jgi:DEAD/DEAH box helicase domain-containing protein
MLPLLQAEEIKQSVIEYLKATFSFSDKKLEHSFEDFLLDKRKGMFKGPYLQFRLPFNKHEDREALKSTLFIQPPFDPYEHQFEAFRRLTTFNGHIPEPVILTTGTGSGKTESFLFPILDYCYMHRNQPGIKAIILYPMNALATDQARRLAELIHSYVDDSGNTILKDQIRAGLFIGEGRDKKKANRATRMGEIHIIEDRDTLVQSPPDILFTNFKMLDFSLLQARFHGIWKYNLQDPELLKYLVLDELHTYDGAKGSDVANLVRRLKLKLNLNKNQLVPVGTSATISGGVEGKEELVKFFSLIFGIKVTTESVIGESRQDKDLFFDKELKIPILSKQAINQMHFVESDNYQDYIKRQLQLWGYEDADPIELGTQLKQNLWLQTLLEVTGNTIKEISEIIPEWSGKTGLSKEYSLEEQSLLFNSLISLVTNAKDRSGKKEFPFIYVQITYWMRSLHKIARKTQTNPVFEWENDMNSNDLILSLPPYFCRECGGSGWVGIKKESSDQFENDLSRTRQMFMADRSNKNIYLISSLHDRQITEVFAEDYSWSGEPVQGYLDPVTLKILEQNGKENLFRIIGVRRQNDDRIEKICPHCNSSNTLALIGTGLPTLESIAAAQVLATATDNAPDRQRKLLAFTNGVQDAAHQAGFIENRNYRFGMRHAIQTTIKNLKQSISLTNLYEEFEKYWKINADPEGGNKSEAYFYKFLPPDCESRIEISDYQNRDKSFKPAFEREFTNRMSWEIWSEFSYNASIGRTLEKSGASATSFPLELMDKVYNHLQEWMKGNALGERISRETFVRFLNGFLHRLRIRGGVDHKYLERYRTGKSSSYLITARMNPGYFLIRSFGPDFRLPRFITVERGPFTEVFDVIKVAKNQNWYSTYFLKSFPLVHREETELINDFYKMLIEYLDTIDLLDKKVAAGVINYGIPSEKISITNQAVGFECDTCGHQMHVGRENADITEMMSCLQYRCPGHYKPFPVELFDYYRMIYNRGRSIRIFAHDHTGLIDRDRREWLENDFKKRPSFKSTNVLVATSTLEMGIDIGDLNVTFNSSLPPETANYLQRVGRAGRLSGNSLILNIAGRDEHDLFFYQDPMSMMGGIIRTPACYLEAKDILKRHFMAYCFDSWASLDPEQNRIPYIIKQLKVKSLEPGDSHFVLTQVRDFIRSNKTDLLEAFLQQYLSDLSENSNAIISLQDQLVTGFLEDQLIQVHKTLKDELRYYEIRRKDLSDQLKNLPETGHETQALKSELKALSGAIKNIYSRNTIEYLTNIGILPNYAFPETGVSIHPHLRKKKELDGVIEYRNEELSEIVRPSSQAITELAPANIFYSQGHKLEAQGLEVLSQDEYEEYRFCSNCDHMTLEVNVPDEQYTCPKCGHGSWGAINNRKTLIRMRSVLSYNDYEGSRINDASDERERKFYQKSVHIQTDPASSKGARILKRVPFGIEFFAKTKYVEINTGVREEGFYGTREIEINGEKVPEVGFVICKTCGKVTERPLTQKEIEKRHRLYHFPYCSNRHQQYVGSKDDYFEEVYIYRHFQTEALKILLPVQEFRTKERVSVFKAGLYLGLKDYYKGHPDHVNIREYQEYNRESGRKEQYLVMYETIPGGTGYLSKLFDPAEFTRLLEFAYDHIRFCGCKDEGKDGCYHCIYTYGNQYEREALSRAEAEELFHSIVEKANEWNEIESLQGAGSFANNEESDLENGFINLLKDKATTWPGWEFKENNEAGIKKYKISIPYKDSSITYEIWPQNLGNYLTGIELKTRPDFVFKCLSILKPPGEIDSEEIKTVKDILIYLDGHQYHASSEHRRLPSDIKIRNSIINSHKYHLWVLTWKDVEDAKGSVVDNLGTIVQENILKKMVEQHPSFSGHREMKFLFKNNFERFIFSLQSPLEGIQSELWSSLILFIMQEQMLAKCYSKTQLEDSIQHCKLPDPKTAVKGNPEFYAHIDLPKFQEELQFNLFVHPQTFSLIGFSLFDSEKAGWELGNWNTFWETYNLTQFHGINTLSITELTEHAKEGKSHLQHILENFDPELHDIVLTLIENKININEEFDFDLLDGEEIIAQAELGSHESKFYIKPFDEESKKVFLKNGYKELLVESFDIKQIIT